MSVHDEDTLSLNSFKICVIIKPNQFPNQIKSILSESYHQITYKYQVVIKLPMLRSLLSFLFFMSI